MCIEIQPESEW